MSIFPGTCGVKIVLKLTNIKMAKFFICMSFESNENT